MSNDRRRAPTLLGDAPPILRSYSPYLVIAEKFHAIARLGTINSRMKDYFDLWLIPSLFDLEKAILRQAIKETFVRRQTRVPTARPDGLSALFYGDPAKIRQWEGFVKKAELKETPSLEEACAEIWSLIGDAL